MTHALTFTAGLLAGCFGAAWLIGWVLSSGRESRRDQMYRIADEIVRDHGPALDALGSYTTRTQPMATFRPIVEGEGNVNFRWPQ